jgi:pyruvate kinase
MRHAKNVLQLEKGDNVILTGGQTSGISGNTNTIRLETV